jgi:hypothetical protein
MRRYREERKGERKQSGTEGVRHHRREQEGWTLPSCAADRVRAGN